MHRNLGRTLAAAAALMALAGARAEWEGFAEPEMLHQRTTRLPLAGDSTPPVWDIGGVLPIDLDGDGALDFLTTELYVVHMYRNEGNLHFRHMGVAEGIAEYPNGPAVLADLDGDGLDDLLYPSYGFRPAAYRSLGDFRFEEFPSTLPRTAERHSYDNVSAKSLYRGVDIDGDGREEVLALDHLEAEGMFQPHAHAYELDAEGALSRYDITTPFPGDTYVPDSLAHGDVDGNGTIDVVVAVKRYWEGYAVDLFLCLGNGDGTFGERTLISTEPEAPQGYGFSIQGLIDMNRDGRADLVTKPWPTQENGWPEAVATIRFALGDGTFDPVPLTFRLGTLPNFHLMFPDLNADGTPDIIADTELLLLSRPGGGWEAAPPDSRYALYAGDYADLDGDGGVELISYAFSYPGRVTSPSGTYIPLTNLAADLRFARLQSGSERLSLVVGNSSGTRVGVLRAAEDGFMPWKPIDGCQPLPEDDEFGPEDTFGQLAVGDADGDGDDDVVVARPNADDSLGYTRIAAEGGALLAPEILPAPVAGTGHSAPLLLDVDLDGDLDLLPPAEALVDRIGKRAVAANFTGSPHPDICVLTDGNLEVHRGDGGSTFTLANTAPLPVTNPFPPAYAADIDGDGHQDLAICDLLQIRLHFGDGAGSFPRSLVLTSPGDEYLDIAVADFDSDGRLDIAAGGADDTYAILSGFLDMRFQQPDGTFAAAPRIALPAQAGILAAADADGDGDTDLATACLEPWAVYDLQTTLQLQYLRNRTFDGRERWMIY